MRWRKNKWNIWYCIARAAVGRPYCKAWGVSASIFIFYKCVFKWTRCSFNQPLISAARMSSTALTFSLNICFLSVLWSVSFRKTRVLYLATIPWTDPNVSLYPHNPLLVQHRMRLTNETHHILPGTFCPQSSALPLSHIGLRLQPWIITHPQSFQRNASNTSNCSSASSAERLLPLVTLMPWASRSAAGLDLETCSRSWRKVQGWGRSRPRSFRESRGFRGQDSLEEPYLLLIAKGDVHEGGFEAIRSRCAERHTIWVTPRPLLFLTCEFTFLAKYSSISFYFVTYFRCAVRFSLTRSLLYILGGLLLWLCSLVFLSKVLSVAFEMKASTTLSLAF